MPTTALNLIADVQSSVKMKWKEQYVTEALNRKMAFVTPRGIYRGWGLGTSGLALTVNIVADTAKNDHVAIYETVTGYSVAIRKTPGTFAVDLTAYASKTVVIALYVGYTVGADTTAGLRVYELLPADEFTPAVERPELVILGTVVVPGSGVIPAANITYERRTLPWENATGDGVPWYPLLANGSFEHQRDVLIPSVAGASFSTTGAWEPRLPFWRLTGSASPGSGRWQVIGTDSSGKGSQCLQLDAGALSSTLTIRIQPMEFGAIPASAARKFKLSFAYKPLVQPSSGVLRVYAVWLNEEGSGPTTTYTQLGSDLDMTVSASWRTFEATFVAPSGQRKLVGVQLYSGTAPSTPSALAYTVGAPNTAVLRLDNFQLWADADIGWISEFAQRKYAIQPVQKLIIDPNIGYDADLERALIQLRAGQTDEVGGAASYNRLEIIRWDEDPDNTDNIAVAAYQFISGSDLASNEEFTKQRPKFKALYGGQLNSILAAATNKTVKPTWSIYTGRNGALGEGYINSIIFVINCVFDQTTQQYQAVDSAKSAYQFIFGEIPLSDTNAVGNGFLMRRKDAPIGAPWDPEDWDEREIDLPAGGTTGLDLTASLMGALFLARSMAANTSTLRETPRLEIFSGTSAQITAGRRACIFRATPAAGVTNDSCFGIYYTGNKQFEIVTNAFWDDTNNRWQSHQQTAGSRATKLTFDVAATGALKLQTVVTDSLPNFTDGQWASLSPGAALEVELASAVSTQTAIKLSQTQTSSPTNGGSILNLVSDPTVSGNRVLFTGGSFPHATQPNANALYQTNVPKAWGVLDFTGTTRTILDGFNVSSLGTSGLGIRVTMPRTMTGVNNYAVILGGEEDGVNVWAVRVSATTFDIFAELGNGTDVDLTNVAGSFTIGFVVMGEE